MAGDRSCPPPVKGSPRVRAAISWQRRVDSSVEFYVGPRRVLGKGGESPCLVSGGPGPMGGGSDQAASVPRIGTMPWSGMGKRAWHFLLWRRSARLLIVSEHLVHSR